MRFCTSTYLEKKKMQCYSITSYIFCGLFLVLVKLSRYFCSPLQYDIVHRKWKAVITLSPAAGTCLCSSTATSCRNQYSCIYRPEIVSRLCLETGVPCVPTLIRPQILRAWSACGLGSLVLSYLGLPVLCTRHMLLSSLLLLLLCMFFVVFVAVVVVVVVVVVHVVFFPYVLMFGLWR